MSVYVDSERNAFGRMIMCHMIADDLDELHAMAESIGLKRAWFQGSGSFPHYDLSLSRRAMAVKRGAISLPRREFISVMKGIRERMRAKASRGPDITADGIATKRREGGT